MHLLVERFSFGDIDQGSLKEGAKTYLMAQMYLLFSWLANFSLSSHLY